MKRNVPIIAVVFILLVSACAPQATPTVDPASVQQTAQAAAFTMVADTQQAMPTATELPPTATATPAATETRPPLPTLDTQGTPATAAAGATLTTPSTSVALPTGLPTFTSQPAQSSSGSSGNQDICNQALTSWQGPTANFSISNQTKPQGTIILSMYVTTEFGQCGYLIITGDSFSGPTGQYSAGAFITGKQNMKAFGSFRITEGRWKIVVRNDSILAQGGCSPDC